MKPSTPDRRLTTAVITAVLALTAFVLVYIFSDRVGERVMVAVSDVGDVLAVGLCAGLCFLLWRTFEPREILKRVWLFFGIGLGLWTVAETIYAVVELVVRGSTPYQSPGDILFVLGFIPIIAGLWLRYRSLRVPLSRGQWAALAVGFVVLGGLSLAFVVIPNLPNTSADVLASRAIAPANPEVQTEAIGALGDLALGVAYALGDLALAVAVGLTILSLLGGQLSRSWLLIAVGCLIIAFADNLFYSGVPTGAYSSAVPVNLFTALCDFGYFGGYVVTALGIYDQALLQRAV